MSETKSITELQALVEDELKLHPECGSVSVTLCEVASDPKRQDWDIQVINAGATRELEACELRLKEIVPRLKQRYRLK
ncbi:MAG: hypothetical protein ACJ8AS_09750 [Hyphomicrobiales bacterium]